MVSQIVASKLSGLVYTAENERFVSVTEKLQHPLQKMRLGAFYLSGNKLKTQKYQMRLSILLMERLN